MNGFEKRKEAIKEKIKNTVLQMLTTREPKSLRIADIATEAEVSQVTIYNYFGNKEALLREVFIEYIEEKVNEFETFVESGPPLKEVVSYSIFLDREAFASFTPQFIQQQLAGDPELERYIERLTNERAMPLFVRFIEDAKRRGEVSDKVPTSTIVAYIQMYSALSQQFLAMAQQSGRGEQFAEEMIHLFFYGICGLEPGDITK
ncbi:TetR/AcrR family transcriptional regulator [Paenibacillus harenae]|uniref:TetR/AcrR family transcriptional regulator n=1 Tax=Paenibacillus harenae TaxID=306543 RepID=UPI002790A4FC|nr:TetR/AcrR family transcriptional regulator [Paenibacillus harenae]MDQ0060289.1 AcrR family transcriptional regulator [Paenibacillus harenae]